ncbi:MAG: CocE/NonD family hydrolase [bacterium]|nr:CocE/NonD family hydrolase [bacterium]
MKMLARTHRGSVPVRLILLAALVVAGFAAADTAMVPMRDGVKLATDCYVPEGDGPFPVLLARTVYGKSFGKNLAQTIVPQGMALVVQDTRGRGKSEGAFNAFVVDGWGTKQDGADTLAWLRAQPWCNGKIGMFGGSALSIVQVLAAGADPDITCQEIMVASSTLYGQLSYQGGVFRKALCENWLNANKSPELIDVWRSHPTNDAFWRDCNAEEVAGRINTPALHVGGWWDIFAQGTINNFVTRQYRGGPKARGNQLLIMGPWLHGPVREPGDVVLRDNYMDVDFNAVAGLFHGHWLLGEDNGVMDQPAVRYYTIGDLVDPVAPGNEWREADGWPPFATDDVPLYLVRGGGLADSAPFPRESTFVYDPVDPCPTRGGANLTIDAGPFDQRPVSMRSDVLRFATPPLPRPVEVTGHVRARLYVSTDAPDTDFTAKLVDIYPDGREILLVDGIRRLKFRKGFETPEPVDPGTIAELEIDLWSISVVFNRGHRIGLQVSSSNYPRFEKNPNTGEDFPEKGGELRAALNTVHMSQTHPSAVILPMPR